MDVADLVMVMRRGKYIKEMKKTETSIEELSYLMVGRKLASKEVYKQETGENILNIKDLYCMSPDKKNILNGLNIHVDARDCWNCGSFREWAI